MGKLYRLAAAALMTATMLAGACALASAEPASPPGVAVPNGDVGWGLAPAVSPSPTPTVTTKDVGWG